MLSIYSGQRCIAVQERCSVWPGMSLVLLRADTLVRNCFSECHSHDHAWKTDSSSSKLLDESSENVIYRVYAGMVAMCSLIDRMATSSA